MKLIIGIGNPGEKYRKNRHNVGWFVLEALKQEISKSEFLISKQIPNPNFKFQKKLQSEILKIQDLVLAKPQTMMNLSGQAVKKLITHYSPPTPDLWVIHDDLDLQLGSYKIQKGKGPKEHKGLLSIYNSLGSKDFWHVRVGVENRTERTGEPHFAKATRGKEYVLQDFTRDELEILGKTINNIVKELLKKVSLE